jgi:hypothetical protein
LYLKNHSRHRSIRADKLDPHRELLCSRA